MSDVTTLLERWNRGERDEHTLQPTALVHEAYMRLIGLNRISIDDRRHFFGAAAGTMRRILVDHARQRRAHERGGPDAQRVAVESLDDFAGASGLDCEALDDALVALAAVAPEQARAVDLRYFAGLSIEETADVMGISPATVKRHWAFARAWLFRALDPRSENRAWP